QSFLWEEELIKKDSEIKKNKDLINNKESEIKKNKDFLAKKESEIKNLEDKLSSIEKSKEKILLEITVLKNSKEKAQKETEEAYKSLKDLYKSISSKDIDEAMKYEGETEKEKIMKAISDLASKHPKEIALEIKKNAEIKNRIDICEVHIYDDDKIRIKRPDQEAKLFITEDSDTVSKYLYDYVNMGNQPKNLFLIMFTTGDCRVVTRDRVNVGINKAIQEIRKLNTGASIQCTVPSFISLPPEK
ncbi:MAG: hypothetical protein WCJ72_19230, partial [Chryseobacterium sp.]